MMARNLRPYIRRFRKRFTSSNQRPVSAAIHSCGGQDTAQVRSLPGHTTVISLRLVQITIFTIRATLYICNSGHHHAGDQLPSLQRYRSCACTLRNYFIFQQPDSRVRSPGRPSCGRPLLPAVLLLLLCRGRAAAGDYSSHGAASDTYRPLIRRSAAAGSF